MDTAKRKALEAAGWKVGDASDFLEMDNAERQLLDTRVQLALAVRQQRETQKLTQKELAAKLKTSQPRIVKIERAASDVSLDQLVRALIVAGGEFTVKSAPAKRRRGKKVSNRASGSLVLEVATSK